MANEGLTVATNASPRQLGRALLVERGPKYLDARDTVASALLAHFRGSGIRIPIPTRADPAAENAAVTSAGAPKDGE